MTGDPRKAATSPFWNHKTGRVVIHETKVSRIVKDEDRAAQKTSRRQSHRGPLRKQGRWGRWPSPTARSPANTGGQAALPARWPCPHAVTWLFNRCGRAETTLGLQSHGRPIAQSEGSGESITQRAGPFPRLPNTD